MFKFLIKPKIKATLINKGSSVKVSIINATAEQTMIILFLLIKQVAKSLNLEHRQLLNRIIDLDKNIVRAQNRDKKEAYKQQINSKK